jgi:protein-disulfide isomerase
MRTGSRAFAALAAVLLAGAALLGCAPRPHAGYAAVKVGDAPSRGPAGAIVIVVEFADFRCAHCVQMLPILERLQQEHPDDIRFVFKHYPIVSAESTRAAQAAVAAQRQGAFWPMHDALFSASQLPLDDAALVRMAGALGLDVARFRADLDAPETAAQVQADRTQGRALGLRGTPAFFVNDRPMPGAQSYQALEYAVLEVINAG